MAIVGLVMVYCIAHYKNSPKLPVHGPRLAHWTNIDRRIGMISDGEIRLKLMVPDYQSQMIILMPGVRSKYGQYIQSPPGLRPAIMIVGQMAELIVIYLKSCKIKLFL